MNLNNIIEFIIQNFLIENNTLNANSNLINEDIALANKLLKDRNISPDNHNFLKTKDFLLKNNALGYLGIAVKLDDTKQLYNLKHIVDFILNNRDILKLLPKNILSYDDYKSFQEDVVKIQNQRKIKKLTNKLTNKNIINQLNKLNLYDDDNIDVIPNIEYFTNNINSSDQKEFLTKTDKYNDLNSFLYDLSEFVENHKIGFNYKNVLNKINSMNEDDIKILFNSNNMILCRIYTYNASKEIGSKSWCIVGSEKQFNTYTQNQNYQYFFFNFNENIPKAYKMIAFTMDHQNIITASHDRYDEPFNNPLGYLNSIGIKEKVLLFNSREFFKLTLNKSISDQYTLIYQKINTHDYQGNKITKYKPNFNNSDLFYLITKFLELLNKTNSNHLDLLTNKIENYPTKYIEYTDDGDTNYVDYKNYNLFIYILKNYDSILSKFSEYIKPNTIPTKNNFIEILKKIYLSNINLNNETKRELLHFLKDNNIDILKLAQQKKSKRNQDLSPEEFGMLSKKGENLKPIIQNKLSAIRRGENVEMNDTEINYAIDNGFKNIITKYYKNLLPYFEENQLQYEDAMIYKKLNMINDISQIIINKANIYGLDSLNSIEKSLYDTYKYKK